MSNKPIVFGFGKGVEFVASLVIICVYTLAVFFLPNSYASFILGLIYVLFLPGYALVNALFPVKSELTHFKKLVLSFGLSVVIMIFVGLLLNQTTWGITWETLYIFTTSLTLILSGVAYYRKGKLPMDEQILFRYKFNLPYTWTKISYESPISAVLLLVLFGCTSLIIYLAGTLQPKEEYSEFFILDREKLANNYPVSVVVNELSRIKIGIVNHEQKPLNYRVEAWAIDPQSYTQRKKLTESSLITLSHDQNFEGVAYWRMPWIGNRQKVEFLLFVGENTIPYRSIHIWVDVLPMKRR